MLRRLPKRPPVYGQHGHEEADEEGDFQSEENDVFLPSCGGRGLRRKVTLCEPWQRGRGGPQGGRRGVAPGLVGRLERGTRARTRRRIVAYLHGEKLNSAGFRLAGVDKGNSWWRLECAPQQISNIERRSFSFRPGLARYTAEKEGENPHVVGFQETDRGS